MPISSVYIGSFQYDFDQTEEQVQGMVNQFVEVAIKLARYPLGYQLYIEGLEATFVLLPTRKENVAILAFYCTEEEKDEPWILDFIDGKGENASIEELAILKESASISPCEGVLSSEQIEFGLQFNPSNEHVFNVK